MVTPSDGSGSDTFRPRAKCREPWPPRPVALRRRSRALLKPDAPSSSSMDTTTEQAAPQIRTAPAMEDAQAVQPQAVQPQATEMEDSQSRAPTFRTPAQAHLSTPPPAQATQAQTPPAAESGSLAH